MGAAASVTQPRQLKDLKAVAKSCGVEWTPQLQKAFNAAKKRTKVATINDVLGKLPKNLQRKLQKVIDEELQQKQVEEEGAERAADGAEMAAESAGKSNLPSEGGAQGADMQGQQQSEHGGAPREAIPAAMATEAETAAVVKVQAVVRGRQARHPKEETPAERETRLAEEAAAAKAAREAELLARKDGHVVCHYNMYHESFPISDNKLKAFEIDDMYCLSDIMPGCIVRLSYIDNTKFKGERWELPFVPDDSNGVLTELMDGEEYWVVVIENEEQLKKDQAETAARMAELGTADSGEPQTGVTRKEGCSCIYGNPCTDKYVCNSWETRFAVARNHGWKG
eukprot:INCI13485.10.p2 GENE.INCI13485.10~~INCI13485.10.p2  ORF type:complete len:339 (-),score=75.80 INCI13485.10:2848-3864(-)